MKTMNELFAIQNEVMVKVVSVESKVDAMAKQVNIIMDEVKALKYNNVKQEPTIPSKNPGQTSHQYNQKADERPVKYHNKKGQAVFDVCDKCGYELTSPRPGAYCDSNPTIPGVFCPKCQKALGYDASSLGLSKAKRTINANEKPKNQPAPKGYPVTCAICKGKVYFDTKGAITEAFKRATAAGYSGIVHRGCAKKHDAVSELKISVPSVEEKIANTKYDQAIKNADSTKIEAEMRKDKAEARKVSIDSVDAVVNILLGKGITADNIKAMPIKDVRKVFEGMNIPLELDGNTWNKTKVSVVDAVCVPAKEEIHEEPQMEFTAVGYEEDEVGFGSAKQDF